MQQPLVAGTSRPARPPPITPALRSHAQPHARQLPPLACRHACPPPTPVRAPWPLTPPPAAPCRPLRRRTSCERCWRPSPFRRGTCWQRCRRGTLRALQEPAAQPQPPRAPGPPPAGACCAGWAGALTRPLPHPGTHAPTHPRATILQADADLSELKALFVDGGASQNGLLMQLQADVLQVCGRPPPLPDPSAARPRLCGRCRRCCGDGALPRRCLFVGGWVGGWVDCPAPSCCRPPSPPRGAPNLPHPQVPVRRPANLETTSLGAALAAGIGAGFWTREQARKGAACGGCPSAAEAGSGACGGLVVLLRRRAVVARA